ncbi:MAG: hypothetical protein R3B47_03450 [Bacteroidia bacterium]
MHKTLHIILAMLLVWSSSGLPLARHYCMGMLKSAGWYEVKMCSHDILKKGKADQDTAGFSAKSCCDNEITWVQTDETTFVKNDPDLHQVLFLPPLPFFLNQKPDNQLF